MNQGDTTILMLFANVGMRQAQGTVRLTNENMRHAPRWVDTEGEEAGANRQTASLAALALTLLLVVVALGLTHILQRKATIEDCLMTGRTNCAPVIDSATDR